MHPILNIATAAARKAGNVIIRSLERLDTVRTTTKGLNNFVTDTDKRAEEEIIAIIRKAYPNHQIMAEESGLHSGSDEYVWIIDPLDGTHNYLHGFPHFSISIAFQAKGRLEHALVYDPIRQEIFTASRGEGARCNDKRLRINAAAKLENALIGTGFPVRQPQHLPGYLAVFQMLIPKIANIRCSGSAALDLAYVAGGRLDGFLQVDLHPWDIAAGALLIKESGGLVADWRGEEHYLTKGNIVAGVPKVFSAMMPIIAKYQQDVT